MTLQWIVLIAYLIALMAIAVISYNKIHTHNDFFIAGKSGTVLTITGSLIATILGGSAVIGAINEAPILHWSVSWFMICAAIGLFVIIPFAGTINNLGKYTLPDLLDSMHGKSLKTISSFIIPVAWIGIISAQIIAAARLLASYAGIDYQTGVVISGIVFVVYTLAGGQFSILKTDLFQSILIILGLITVFLFSIKYANSNHLPVSLPRAMFHEKFSGLSLFVLILTYSTTFSTGPDIYSRLFCSKSKSVVQNSLLLSGLILLPVAFLIGFIGTFGVDNELHHTNGLLLVNVTKLVLPAWAVALIVVALLSAVLSSADTTLLSASVIVTDIIQKGGFNQKTIPTTRLSILVIGIISIVISLLFTSIIGILLFALAIYAGAFTLPILLGLMKFRFKPRYMSMAVIVGGSVAFIGKIISHFTIGINGDMIVIASFMVSGILLFLGKENSKTPFRSEAQE